MNRIICEIYSSHAHRFAFKKACELYFSRKAPAGGKTALFIFQPEKPVAFSQLNPFLFYEDEIRVRYDIHFRAVAAPSLEYCGVRNADLVCVQTPFDISEADTQSLFTRIGALHPNAKVVYFDWFAPLDLRLAQQLNPYIDGYVKRQIFSDLEKYRQPTMGDTNLMDHYCRRFQLPAEEQFFPVPEGFFQKLIVGPGLFTGNYLLKAFHQNEFRDQTKSIDLHARLGGKGTPWYTAMRNEAAVACRNLRGLEIRQGGGISSKQYFQELAQSKLCFSPFGYGEVCWRDFEAIQAGALLLKPDMSHLRTEPDIYRDGETYVSIAWDYSDLQEKANFYAHNDKERRRIVDNAREIMRDYTQNLRFLEQMEPVFQLAHGMSNTAELHLTPLPPISTVELAVAAELGRAHEHPEWPDPPKNVMSPLLPNRWSPARMCCSLWPGSLPTGALRSPTFSAGSRHSKGAQIFSSHPRRKNVLTDALPCREISYCE